MKKLLEPLFEENDNQSAVVVGIYKKFIPDYDEIENIAGHPTCGKVMSEWLFEKFIEFDGKHHPEVIAGGAWLNWGFSTDEKMGWEVSLETCTFTYGENHERNPDSGSVCECLALVAVG